MISVERINEFIELESEKHESNSIEEYEESDGSIEFEHVNISYNSKDNILESISFRIDSGKMVGIIGRTGAGKTTIFMALLRLVEISNGRISIGGQDISKTKLKDLRKKISVIPVIKMPNSY